MVGRELLPRSPRRPRVDSIRTCWTLCPLERGPGPVLQAGGRGLRGLVLDKGVPWGIAAPCPPATPGLGPVSPPSCGPTEGRREGRRKRRREGRGRGEGGGKEEGGEKRGGWRERGWRREGRGRGEGGGRRIRAGAGSLAGLTHRHTAHTKQSGW